MKVNRYAPEALDLGAPIALGQTMLESLGFTPPSSLVHFSGNLPPAKTSSGLRAVELGPACGTSRPEDSRTSSAEGLFHESAEINQLSG